MENSAELHRRVMTNSFDAYGAPTLSVEEEYRGSQRLAIQQTAKSYLHRAAAPRVFGLPLTKTVYAASPSQGVVAEEYTYDGMPLGSVGATLDQTGVRRRKGDPAAPWEQVTRSFDSFGNLLSEITPDGLVKRFEYSPDGRQLVALDGSNGRQLVTIDPAHGYMVRSKSSAGIVSRSVMDAWGEPIEQRVETEGGTLLQRSTRARFRTGKQEVRCDYGGATLALYRCQTTYRDDLGRTYKEVGPNGFGTVTEFDSRGFPTRVSNPHLVGVTSPIPFNLVDFDSRGRVVKQTAVDGLVTQIRYNDGTIAPNAVRRRTVTDPKGLVTITHEDFGDRPIRVEEPRPCPSCAVPITGYEYDSRGRLSTIVRPDGTAIEITYDVQGNRRTLRDPNSGLTTTTYHMTPGHPRYGQLATETRPAPNAISGNATVTTALDYDAHGRISSRNGTDGSTTSWSYDDSATGAGRLSQVWNATGEMITNTELTYDQLGREATRDVEISGQVGSTPLDLAVHFESRADSMGNPLSFTYPDGEVASYTYYQGLLPQNVSIGSVFAGYSLYSDPWLRPMRTHFGNGLTGNLNFLAKSGRLEQQLLGKAGVGYVYRKGYNYEYGRLSKIIDVLHPTRTLTYTYDGLDRLTQATRNDGTVFQYGFDAGGNLVTKSGFDADGDLVLQQRTPVAGTNRLANDGLGNALTWGIGGHLLGKGDLAYGYDDGGLLTEVRRNGQIVERHLHDHDQQRIVTVEPRPDGALVTYDLSGVYQVRQRVRNGQVTAEQRVKTLFLGDMPHARITTGDSALEPERPNPSDVPGVRYLHSDPVGSTQLVSDEQGNLVAELSYTPYGELDESIGNAHGERRQFAGAEAFEASGLLAMGIRHYDPSLGQFTAPDTMAGNPMSSLDLNPYLYARGNPVSYRDPSGRFPVLLVVIGALAGAVIGGTHGEILSDPGKWMDVEQWKNFDLIGGAIGAVVGGALGYGYAALGGLGGTFLGVKVSTLAQGALSGGSIETAFAWAKGERDVGDLAGHFAVGAFNSVMAKTGFFGAAQYGVTRVSNGLGGFLIYGAAMAADSMTASLLRGMLDDQAPFEITFYGVTVSRQRDGTWTHRLSWAMLQRYIIFIRSDGSQPWPITDFGPLHRDRFYQEVNKALDRHSAVTYNIAFWVELGLMTSDVQGQFPWKQLVNPRLYAAMATMAVPLGVVGAPGMAFEEQKFGCGFAKHCRYE
jgi:RHS repeat-associated protein